MTSETQLKPLSHSSFNKWRCLIALAHIDAKLQPTERQFFVEKLQNLESEYITEPQMEVLLDDLKKKKQPQPFFEKIDSELQRIELLRLAHELFWVDGEYEDRERKAYEFIRGSLSRILDVERFVLDDIAKLRGSESEIYKVIQKMLQDSLNPLGKAVQKDKSE